MAKSVILLLKIFGHQMDLNNLPFLVDVVPVWTTASSSPTPTNGMSSAKHAQSLARAIIVTLSIRSMKSSTIFHKQKTQ